jgi:hypothetical protein
MKKPQKPNIIPDLREFTDEEGKKWIQTSTDDLFSMKEFNDIITSIEKDREKGEIVLARIDFKKVNREYYETAVALQEKLDRQTELLKKLAAESRETINRKNLKLKELIEYIRKLHYFIASLNSNIKDIDKVRIMAVPAESGEPAPEKAAPAMTRESKPLSVYEEVKEEIIPLEG